MKLVGKRLPHTRRSSLSSLKTVSTQRALRCLHLLKALIILRAGHIIQILHITCVTLDSQETSGEMLSRIIIPSRQKILQWLDDTIPHSLDEFRVT